MLKFLKKAYSYNEVRLASVFAIIVLVFSCINPDCFTLANLYSLIGSTAINAIYALGVMVVMCSGAIDSSCAVIGSFGSYLTMYILVNKGFDPHPAIIFLMSIVICVLLEMINWFMVGVLHFDSYIATTGTASLLRGAVLVCVSTTYLYTLPSKIGAMGLIYLDTATYSSGIQAPLHISFIFLVIFYVVMHLVMTYTNIGRQIYAVGADEEAARRAGINVKKIRFIVFAVCGIICGFAGVLRDSVARYSFPNPSDVVGRENISIASVILGTGNNTKARGSTLGTLLGVFMMNFIENNLIMIGVNTFWITLFTGIIMYIGVVGQMSKRTNRRAKKEI